MWVIYLEIGLVLFLIAFILWWTWPKKKDKNDGQ
jgi:cbb3-type cytochrome oxidase subunit 3